MKISSNSFGKCPKCGNTEDIELKELRAGSTIDEEVGDSYLTYQARCPVCGFHMRRQSANDLREAWSISKEKRVKHVKDCIKGIPSVVYPGGCAYIGPDTVEMWRDKDGGLGHLERYLHHKVGKIVKITKPSDGVGVVVYCDKVINKKSKINSFVAGLTQ